MKKERSILTTSFIWKFGERFLAQIVSFIVSIVLARILVPEDYGVVSLILVFIAFADVFVTSGFSTSLIQKRDATDVDFSTIFYCSLFVSIIIYVILFFSAPYIAAFFGMPALSGILRVFSLRIPISAFNSVQHAYVSRNMLFRKFFFSTLWGTLLSGVLGIVAAYLGMGAWALIIQYMSNTIVDTIVLSFTIKWRPRLVFSIASAKKLMQYGWKILLADLSGTFFEQLRSLIIGKVYTTSDLAYYNRGKSFSSLVMDNISTAMMSVLFPDLANKSDDLEKVKLTLRKSLSVMLYIIFPLIGGLVVIAKPLVNVLLTEKWKQAIPFLQLLAVSSGIGLIGNISLQSIKAIGRSDIVLKLELIKKPIEIESLEQQIKEPIYLILLIIGIKISPIAIAVTMVLYSFYSSIANAMPLKKELNYTYKQQISDILPSLAATVIMCIAIAPFRAVIKSDVILLFIQVICGGFIYAMESIIFKISAFQYIKKIIIKGKSNE